MIWLPLAGPALLAVAFTLLPGLVIAWVAGLRGFAAVALAPVLSVTSISVGAILGGLLRVPWGWWIPVGVAALMSMVVWSIRHATRRKGMDRWWTGSLRDDLPYWVGLALAIGLMARQFLAVTQRPDWFAQRFDNLFHLSAVRYIVQTSDASSLTLGRLTSGDVPVSFYPAAFHDGASLVLLSFPESLTVAVNAMLFAIVVVVWPVSCLALARLALPGGWASALGASVALAALPAFPLRLLDFGVIYPNLLGYALFPSVLALAIQGLRLGDRALLSRPGAAILLMGALPGLALSHPNALMTLVAVSSPPVVIHVTRQMRTAQREAGGMRGAVPAALLGSGFLAAGAAAWIALRPADDSAWWPPITTVPHALGEALLNSPENGLEAWLVSTLCATGLLVARHYRMVWLVGCWAVLVGLWLIVAAAPASGLRTLVTGVYYNDPVRVAAALPLVNVALAGLGLHALAERLTAAIRRLVPSVSVGIPRALAGCALALVALLGTQWAPYLLTKIDYAKSAYTLDAESPMLTIDEWELIERLPTLVPAEAVIATNPWNGSSLAYALTGLRTTTTHVYYTESPALSEIRRSLDEAANSPEICAAVRSLRVTHALDFGERNFDAEATPFPGLDDLASASGFELVDRQGGATLYRVTACGAP